MRRFYRSRNNVMLGGVCGGLGEYFNVDPVLFRILFIFFALTGSLGVWVYLLLWLLSQPQPNNRATYDGAGHRRGEATTEDVDFTYIDEEDKS